QVGRLTRLGYIVGTVDYIAPEQARDARTADIRADVYSLGCALYYLLTGSPPFRGKTPAEKISARVLGDAPSVRKSRPEVPPGVGRVAAQMLARDPTRRSKTPGVVARALTPHTTKGRQPPDRPAPPAPADWLVAPPPSPPPAVRS